VAKLVSNSNLLADANKYFIEKRGKIQIKKLGDIYLTSLSTKWRSTQTGNMKIKNNISGLKQPLK